MKSTTPVAVCSRSFSRHPVLRAELLARYEHVTFNEEGRSLKADDLVAFVRGHAKTIVGLEPFDDAVFTAVPELKVIGKYGVGFDMLDLCAAERHGVLLGWTPGVNKRSVAELALSFAISLLHLVPSASHAVREGSWRPVVGRELSRSTVGLIGFGQIARDLATLLAPFECRLLVCDVAISQETCAQYAAHATNIDDLLAQADIVSLHLPLSDSTRNVLSADRLARMKHGAVLINTARGSLVDEDALEARLREGSLAGAAFDVFATEPPKNRGLLDLPNFLATPHIGSGTEQAILAMGRAAIYGLEHAVAPSALGLV